MLMNAERTRAVISSVMARESMPLSSLVDEANQVKLRDLLSNHASGINVATIPGIDAVVAAIFAINAKKDEFSWFGNPTIDVQPTDLHGGGYYQRFQNGAIYYSASTGAHEIHGAIWDKWKSMGGLKCYLGFPKADEADEGGGQRVSVFQNGRIHWKDNRGIFLDLSLDAHVDEDEQGYKWMVFSGQGFTPDSSLYFEVADLTGAAGPISTGVFVNIDNTTTFDKVFWHGKDWPQGGIATLQATDRPTGQIARAPMPALY